MDQNTEQILAEICEVSARIAEMPDRPSYIVALVCQCDRPKPLGPDLSVDPYVSAYLCARCHGVTNLRP